MPRLNFTSVVRYPGHNSMQMVCCKLSVTCTLDNVAVTLANCLDTTPRMIKCQEPTKLYLWRNMQIILNKIKLYKVFPLFLYPLFCFSKYSSPLRFLFSDSLMMELYLIDPGGLSCPLLCFHLCILYYDYLWVSHPHFDFEPSTADTIPCYFSISSIYCVTIHVYIYTHIIIQQFLDTLVNHNVNQLYA